MKLALVFIILSLTQITWGQELYTDSDLIRYQDHSSNYPIVEYIDVNSDSSGSFNYNCDYEYPGDIIDNHEKPVYGYRNSCGYGYNDGQYYPDVSFEYYPGNQARYKEYDLASDFWEGAEYIKQGCYYNARYGYYGACFDKNSTGKYVIPDYKRRQPPHANYERSHMSVRPSYGNSSPETHHHPVSSPVRSGALNNSFQPSGNNHKNTPVQWHPPQPKLDRKSGGSGGVQLRRSGSSGTMFRYGK